MLDQVKADTTLVPEITIVTCSRSCWRLVCKLPSAGLQDPTSDVYRKALEMTSKAPGLHAELQKQLQEAQVTAPGVCQ